MNKSSISSHDADKFIFIHLCSLFSKIDREYFKNNNVKTGFLLLLIFEAPKEAAKIRRVEDHTGKCPSKRKQYKMHLK